MAGTVAFVKQDGAYYPACPGSFNGKACNKKMADDGSAWSCGRCGYSGAPAWRYMLSFSVADHTGEVWVTAFNEDAEALLGATAESVRALAETPGHDAAFRPLLHADLVLRLKVDDGALMQRVAGRFAESGRPDDNPESFKVRLDAYNTQTAPLLPYYQGQGKLTEVDGMGSIEAVAAGIDGALAKIG